MKIDELLYLNDLWIQFADAVIDGKSFCKKQPIHRYCCDKGFIVSTWHHRKLCYYLDAEAINHVKYVRKQLCPYLPESS